MSAATYTNGVTAYYYFWHNKKWKEMKSFMDTEFTRELLKYLLVNNDFYTSKELATEFGVSDKTVQRCVKKINVTIGKTLIISEKGRGYRLDYEEYLLNKDKINESGPLLENRRMAVMKELLLSSPKSVRVDQLFDKYYVSASVIQNDERSIRRILKKYNLELNRSNRHLVVSGSEKDIRDALMEAILKIDKEVDLASFVDSTELSNRDVRFVLHQINIAERMLKSLLPYPYNINFFAHIYILLNRTRRFVKLSERQSLRYKLTEDIDMNPEIYSVCVQIVQNIQSYLQTAIADNEVGYLFQYLVSSRLNYVEIETSANQMANKIALRYVELINRYLKINILQSDIVQELKKHIIPLLNRLKNRIRLSNALISEIQLEYEKILDATMEASTYISKEFNLPLISKDESGFIALYFAKYLEVHRDKTRILVICTTGIGTSELISTKIKKELPNIEVVGVISSIDLKYILKEAENIDLLVSTVPLKETSNIPDVLVSAIFTNQDKEKVLTAIAEVKVHD